MEIGDIAVHGHEVYPSDVPSLGYPNGVPGVGAGEAAPSTVWQSRERRADGGPHRAAHACAVPSWLKTGRRPAAGGRLESARRPVIATAR